LKKQLEDSSPYTPVSKAKNKTFKKNSQQRSGNKPEHQKKSMEKMRKLTSEGTDDLVLDSPSSPSWRLKNRMRFDDAALHHQSLRVQNSKKKSKKKSIQSNSLLSVIKSSN